jgi:hypothetical protein
MYTNRVYRGNITNSHFFSFSSRLTGKKKLLKEAQMPIHTTTITLQTKRKMSDLESFTLLPSEPLVMLSQ